MPSEQWAEKAREWLNSHCDDFGNVYAGDVDSLAALLEEVTASAVDDFLSEEPCPRCGCGPSWECYGCKLREAERERDEARAEVERLRAERKALYEERGLLRAAIRKLLAFEASLGEQDIPEEDRAFARSALRGGE